MKSFIFWCVIAISTLLLTSCGRKRSIPEQDTSLWKKYDYRFYNFNLQLKYPSPDGNSEYSLYKNHVDVSNLHKNNGVIFFGEWYDIYKYPRFEIMISLANYKKAEEETPEMDDFISDIVASLNNPPLQDRKTYQDQKVIVNGITYLKITIFDKTDRVCREVYVTPLNMDCYLNISADYLENPTKDEDWLSSRRKIFKDFVENIILERPTQDPETNPEGN